MKSSTGDKVDETIEVVCDWIQSEIKEPQTFGMSIANTIKALADLVAARESERG